MGLDLECLIVAVDTFEMILLLENCYFRYQHKREVGYELV